MHDDLFERLEHDHAPMSQLVIELREAFAAPALDMAALTDRLYALSELVLEHFGDEEEVVFPLLAEAAPTHATALAALADAHDAICGVAARLRAQSERPEPDPVGMRTLFDRLEASYAAHAAREQALLREIRDGLAPAALERLRAQLAAHVR